jgi:hypothetical protein
MTGSTDAAEVHTICKEAEPSTYSATIISGLLVTR